MLDVSRNLSSPRFPFCVAREARACLAFGLWPALHPLPQPHFHTHAFAKKAQAHCVSGSCGILHHHHRTWLKQKRCPCPPSSSPRPRRQQRSCSLFLPSDLLASPWSPFNQQGGSKHLDSWDTRRPRLPVLCLFSYVMIMMKSSSPPLPPSLPPSPQSGKHDSSFLLDPAQARPPLPPSLPALPPSGSPPADPIFIPVLSFLLSSVPPSLPLLTGLTTTNEGCCCRGRCLAVRRCHRHCAVRFYCFLLVDRRGGSGWCFAVLLKRGGYAWVGRKGRKGGREGGREGGMMPCLAITERRGGWWWNMCLYERMSQPLSLPIYY